MAQATGSMKAQHRPSDEEVRSTSSTPQQTTLPLYYVERPGTTHHTASGAVITPGPNVPLIAVDQLPAWVDVLGVPRELSREQVANLSLSRVGVTPKGKAYEVYIIPVPPPTYDDAKTRSSQMDPTAKPFTSQKDRIAGTIKNKDGHFSGHMKKDNIPGAGTARGDAAGVRQPVGLHQRPPSPPAVDPSPDNPYPVLYPTTVSSYRTQDTVQRRRKGLQQEHPAERLRQAYHKSSFRRSANTSLLSRSPSLSPSSSSTMTTRGPRKYSSQHDSNSNNNKSKNNNNNYTSSSRKPHNNSTTKIYCRHWCHTGRCKWDDACRYRHDMPNTARELREVGLDGGYPGWWETHLRLVSKQHANLGVVHAAGQHVRPRPGLNGSEGSDAAGTMGSIAGLYPMNMNMNMGTAAGIQGIPLGHMMTGAATMMPGFYHHPQFHNDAPLASTHAHIPLGLHGSDLLSPSAGKKSKKQSTLPTPQQQQQQRRAKHKDIEYKHNGGDEDDDDSSTAEEEYQHRATTTTTKKPKPISAKKRARGSSRSGASTSAYPNTGHNTDSSSPSPSLNPSGTSSSSDVNLKQATAPKGRAQGGEKAHQPRSRINSQARNVSRQNHHDRERSDPRTQTRIPTQQTRRVSHPPDIFEHEIEMALAAARDEEKRKQEEAAAERQTRPVPSPGKENMRNDSHHNDQKGQNTSKAQGQKKGEEDETEKLVDI
ncbi:hypothetical protein HD806DRAFT_93109 [Xylariaceae sp. AK1471]|nr:hypothetical protein HD806DRAFT_93109 [Xylariaceae sp. AK1471]